MDPVTPEDLINAANKLKPKSSEGHDCVSTKIMKISISEIVSPLLHIFNLSFANGVVPAQMKVAKVIPIFKNGDSHSLNNYRPVSILPAFSKLLEKIVYIRLYKFMNSNNVFYSNQYGFRKRHVQLILLFN